MGKLSAWLAIAFGAAIAAAQIARNYDDLRHWPSWSIDLLSAAVLIVAGVRALRGKPTRALMVGWSIACGMYLAGFASHVVSLIDSVGEDATETLLTLIVGGLFVGSVVGLGLILMDRKATGNDNARL